MSKRYTHTDKSTTETEAQDLKRLYTHITMAAGQTPAHLKRQTGLAYQSTDRENAIFLLQEASKACRKLAKAAIETIKTLSASDQHQLKGTK